MVHQWRFIHPLRLVWISMGMIASVSGNANNIFQRGHGTGTAGLDGEATADMSDLARIVGGSTADPTLYPFYAYFEILKTESGQQGNYICGGSLIAPDIVLSAGHCFYGDVQNVAVIVNNTNFSEFTGYEYARQVVSFKVHPDYIHETYTNDICIVVLSSPVAEVTPVALNTERSTPPDGADVQVIGMGFTKEVGPDDDSKPFPDFLLMTELQIVPTDTCSSEYTNAGEQAINGELDICAYATGKDSCQGDSGGPLLQTIDDSFVQVGIVSYGKGCAKEGFPGVYTRVSTYTDFIQSEICGSSQSPPAFCNPNATPTVAPQQNATDTPMAETPTTAPQQNATDAPVTAPTTGTTSAPVEMPAVAAAQESNETPTASPEPVSPNSTESPVLAPMVDTTSPSKIPATESTELPNATPSMSPGAEPTTLNTEPTIAPSISPSLGAPLAVGNSPDSRSIQIARTGQVIATSNNLGPLRFSIIDGEEYTLGLPGGLKSIDALSISNEGFLFGLSVYTPALCSFQIQFSTVIPINCITGDWSLSPFTGVGANGGYIVVSGGEGGMTVATYNTSSGILDDTLSCLNCKVDDTVVQWPDVKVMIQGDGLPVAALSTIWENNVAGTMFVDLTTYLEIRRVVLDSSIGSSLAVTVTNYPLVNDFYYTPQPKSRFMYTAHGAIVVYQIEGANATNALEPPLDDFLATCLSVDEYNGVLVVGGTFEKNRSAVAVYDILRTPMLPRLRATSKVEGRILAVSANGGKVAYVTADTPSILIFGMSEAPSSTVVATIDPRPTQKPTPRPSKKSVSAATSFIPGVSPDINPYPTPPVGGISKPSTSASARTTYSTGFPLVLALALVLF